MFLAASSNTETIHIFRLIQQKEKPPEETNSWIELFIYQLGNVSYHLSRKVAEVFTQDRAFSTLHSRLTRMKITIAMNI
ncbi:unnamed protein product [Rotaria sp. Silwood1]|nr:unnamed protein product [Rotaria sp. Silwood1]